MSMFFDVTKTFGQKVRSDLNIRIRIRIRIHIRIRIRIHIHILVRMPAPPPPLQPLSTQTDLSPRNRDLSSTRLLSSRPT